MKIVNFPHQFYKAKTLFVFWIHTFLVPYFCLHRATSGAYWCQPTSFVLLVFNSIQFINKRSYKSFIKLHAMFKIWKIYIVLLHCRLERVVQRLYLLGDFESKRTSTKIKFYTTK